MKYTITTYNLDIAIDDINTYIEQRRIRIDRICKAKGYVITPEAFEVFMGTALDRKAKLEQLKSLLEEFEGEDFLSTDVDEIELEFNHLFGKNIY